MIPPSHESALQKLNDLIIDMRAVSHQYPSRELSLAITNAEQSRHWMRDALIVHRHAHPTVPAAMDEGHAS